MILISHRGNISGKISNKENSPEYIVSALTKGYNVEIDVWYDNGYWLGHDEPMYNIDKDFLLNDKFWCHAKNIEAFYHMIDDKKIHCFSHDKDEVALTSRGYFWSTADSKMTDKTICVMPSTLVELPKGMMGICSDYVRSYNE